MGGFNNDLVFAKNADFSTANNLSPGESNGLFTDGQIWIGSTAANGGGTHVNVNTLTAGPGITITNGAGTITIGTAGGAAPIEKVLLQTGTSPIVATGGTITFNGATVAAGTNPVRTDGTGPNTMALEVQFSQAIAATDATKVGLANFNSAQFTVDGNGFVGLKGSATNPGILGVHPNATSGGGTDPTVADASGNISILGATVAAGTNPIRSVATAVNSITVQAQFSQAIAATNATNVGLAAFNSAQFTVDASGFVSSKANAPFAWTDEAVSFNALAGNGYFITANATATLPAAPTQGNTIAFAVDAAATTVTITANTGQVIRIGAAVSATAGTAANNARGDSLTLVFRASDSAWIATSVIGTWTIT